LSQDKQKQGVTPAKDIYDLGLVALELLTGKVPCPRRRNLNWDWNDHCIISDQLNAILERMVTADPTQRWQNASEVLSAMGVFVPSNHRPLKGVLVGVGTALLVVVGGLGIGSLFLPNLRPSLPSTVESWQREQPSAAMFRGNLERTGVYPSGGPIELTQLLWKFNTGDRINSSPAVSDGVVYVGSLDSYLYAVDASSRQERWRFRTEGGITLSSPAVSGGAVYVGSGDNYLYAVA
jgi:serine/threonine protein kinase